MTPSRDPNGKNGTRLIAPKASSSQVKETKDIFVMNGSYAVATREEKCVKDWH